MYLIQLTSPNSPTGYSLIYMPPHPLPQPTWQNQHNITLSTIITSMTVTDVHQTISLAFNQRKYR